jgi:predicted metal-dependent RNase
MHPKGEGMDALPNYAAVPQGKADAILISHAHHDHIGSLPVLQRQHPEAPVYMTEFTGEVGTAMMHNSVNVMSKQRVELGIMEYPFFTHKDIDLMRKQWNYLPLKKEVPLGNSDVLCSFHDAGHILGSSGILLREDGKSLFYTGDVSFDSQTMSLPADFPTNDIDVLIMETTRGDYQRPADYSRRTEKERMAKVITDTYNAGGSVLIPVFALGKTQEVMLMLHEMHEHNLIPEMPLFIGGLSTKVTQIHDQYASKTRRAYPGFRLLEDVKMLVATRKQKSDIKYHHQSIYALSSGMMTEHTTSNSFAQKFIDNPKNSVVFVGYTDHESPGYKLRHAQPGSSIKLAKDLPPVQVNARIESFDFSAHATRETLLDYALKVKPKKVLLVHGDEPAQLWFTAQINAALPQTEVIRPEPNAWVDLW